MSKRFEKQLLQSSLSTTQMSRTIFLSILLGFIVYYCLIYFFKTDGEMSNARTVKKIESLGQLWMAEKENEVDLAIPSYPVISVKGATRIQIIDNAKSLTADPKIRYIEQNLINQMQAQKLSRLSEIRYNGKLSFIIIATSLNPVQTLMTEFPLDPLLDEFEDSTPDKVHFSATQLGVDPTEIRSTHPLVSRTVKQSLMNPGTVPSLQVDLDAPIYTLASILAGAGTGGLVFGIWWYLLKRKQKEHHPKEEYEPLDETQYASAEEREFSFLLPDATPVEQLTPSQAKILATNTATREIAAQKQQTRMVGALTETEIKAELSKSATPAVDSHSLPPLPDTTPAKTLVTNSVPTELALVDHEEQITEATTEKSKTGLTTVMRAVPAQNEGANIESLFRAYDIRGDIEIMSEEFVIDIGQSIATQMKRLGQLIVVLGYDVRTSSPHLAKCIAQGLTQGGMQVVNIGCCPTPMMHYAASFFQRNGVMVTASHNPANQNGFKWVIAGAPPTPEQIKEIRILALARDFVEGRGTMSHEDFTAGYLRDISKSIALMQPLKVAIDGLNGAMGQLAQMALTNIGCRVISRCIDFNGVFPEGNPNPSEPKRLNDLKQMIIAQECDVGFAYDGDGDRMVMLDSAGKIVSPDYIIMILAKLCLADQPGGDVYIDGKCSRAASKEITNLGGSAHFVRSGNTFVKRAVFDNTENTAFGAEFSGHYVLRDERGFFVDDALLATLRLVEYIANSGLSLNAILAMLPQRFGSQDIYIPKNVNDNPEIFDQLTDLAKKLPDVKVSRLDGVRLDFEHGFALLRMSNTGPNFTARFDADSADQLEEIQNTFTSLVQKVSPGLSSVLKAHLLSII